ncbi:DUF1707 SHOCT-like domain-containing protein [Streptomyces sp. WZ-12]|uniref:DUF1707 SHOCT-like domain-containing protein n=1 Tax=Streptomyces sp. WZ-12 TaxID=3030210 RepID=UPI0023814CAC|nr:DUF1707 domain-containing protein [Streptomyces sp. WZ-12]
MPGETSTTGRPQRPSAAPALRASHADRDRTVDLLRIAAGDGRLTAVELDERLESALGARTLGELAALTTDLPATKGTALDDGAADLADVLRIDQEGGSFRRDSRWTVPRRVEILSSWSEVTLDFTEAVLTRDTLRIDMDMRGGLLRLVTRPEIAVHADALAVRYGKVTIPRRAGPTESTVLHVELAGQMDFSRVAVRVPRHPFRRWRHRGSV